jgi:hypothetical protein
VAGFSLAVGAIGITALAIVAAYASFFLGKPSDAKVFVVIIMLINTIPATAAALLLGLLAVLGGGVRVLFWGWIPLTFGLSIPYWLWIERRWKRKLERRISEEVERRIAEGGEGEHE